jgi:hypothetical protein
VGFLNVSYVVKTPIMKSIFYLFIFAAFLSSCGSSKNYLQRTNEDKALQDVVKKLNKSSNDDEATQALPILYKNIQLSHLAKIKNLSGGKDAASAESIIDEYTALQNAYNAVINSSPAFKIVNPVSYGAELLEAKQNVAGMYYEAGEAAFAKGDRENAKQAYNYFKKADKYIPGYKDAKGKMDIAYENSIVNVVINPVEDNSFFFNTGWGNTGYNYSNEYFQQTLVRELQNYNGNRYAARFYTDWEARRENIKPDWVIDLRLRNMDIPYPMNNNYSRNVSAQIQSGRDTSGKAIYQTVYATMNISRSSFNARGDMEVNIKDVQTGKNISYRNYSESYRWEEEEATYTGDSRALSSSDWNIINNNRRNNTPRREDILNELYRKIYPQVKNNILYAADW